MRRNDDHLPRVTSVYRHNIYEELEEICNLIDFRHPMFRFKHKRNRSLGSVQAFIVELCIGNELFRKELRKYMINNGTEWKPTLIYLDLYH